MDEEQITPTDTPDRGELFRRLRRAAESINVHKWDRCINDSERAEVQKEIDAIYEAIRLLGGQVED